MTEAREAARMECLYDDVLVDGCKYWCRPQRGQRSAIGAALADRHYSRKKVGSPQFMPPGEKIVLLTADGGALWAWWRPAPASGIPAGHGLEGWMCSIFRRESGPRASELILDAERALIAESGECGVDGLITFVWGERVKGTNPGYCYKAVGWRPVSHSKDGKKTLLHKPYEMAGVPDYGTLPLPPGIVARNLNLETP